MITLLGSIFGFLGSLIPQGMKYFQDKQDKAHELAILNKQMELQKLGLDQRLNEIQIQAETAQNVAAHSYMNEKSGVSWVDGLSSLVRPAVTFIFFFAF